MIHPARLAIATVALVFAAELGPAIAETSLTSGGPVDPALIEDLVAANSRGGRTRCLRTREHPSSK